MVASAVDPKNPFLILQLPANATPAEIKRAAQLALTRARLEGADTEQGQARLRRIEDAIERLRDPVERIRAGLEWPSLSAAGAAVLRDNPAFASLSERSGQDRSNEVELLVANESLNDRVHARGIFALLRANALLSARVQSRSDARESTAWELATGSRLLRSGLVDWKSAISAREYWIEQRLRAKELGDPRIDPAFMQQLESEVASIPLGLFVSIARDALRVRDAATCSAIVQALRDSPLPLPRIDAALSTVYEPLCARVAPALASFQSAVKELKSKDASTYRNLLQRYHTEVGADVALLLEVGDLPGSNEERIRDESAKALKQLAVAAANNADAYEIASLALTEAKKTAAGASLTAEVIRDQTTVRELSVNAERAKQTAPHSARLATALESRNLALALEAIDKLIPLSSPVDAAQLGELRKQLSSALATELFNQAIARIKARDLTNAIGLLKRAREYETVPSELRTIDETLRMAIGMQVQELVAATGGFPSAARDRPKSGCLIPIVIAALTLLGGVGGVVAALNVAMQATQAQLSPSMMEGK
jgi:hypothetical protein